MVCIVRKHLSSCVNTNLLRLWTVMLWSRKRNYLKRYSIHLAWILQQMQWIDNSYATELKCLYNCKIMRFFKAMSSRCIRYFIRGRNVTHFRAKVSLIRLPRKHVWPAHKYLKKILYI